MPGRPLMLALSIVLLGAACKPAEVSLPNPDGSAVIVHVTDRSGLVTAAGSAPAPLPSPPIGATVSGLTGDGRTLRVAWLGSVCPASLDVVISGSAAALDIRVSEGRPTCVTDQDGDRALDLTLSEPVNADRVTLGVSKSY